MSLNVTVLEIHVHLIRSCCSSLPVSYSNVNLNEEEGEKTKTEFALCNIAQFLGKMVRKYVDYVFQLQFLLMQ